MEEEELYIPMCIICGWYGCRTEHKVDQKTMTFIEKARSVHGWRYGYEKVVYVRGKDKVIIVCKEHGDFEQASKGHLRKNGCKKCSGLDPKISEANFYKNIKELGGTVIGKYVNSGTPVECICKEGHKCNPRPNSVSRGQGICKICSNNDPKIAEENFYINVQNLGGEVKGVYKRNNDPVECICKNGHICYPRPGGVGQGRGLCRICTGKDPNTAEENFYINVQNLGGEVKGEYKGNNKPVKCICKNGHVCYPIPTNIQQEKSGLCKICSNNDPKIAEENFYINVRKLGGEVKGEYKGAHIRVECICSKGHKCTPIPNSIQKGYGLCPRCSQQGYSKAQISWLNYIASSQTLSIQNAENGSEYRIGKYKVDGYCPENNTVYEFHGDFWHGNPKFYDHTEDNPKSKKTYGRLFKDTLHKELYIRNKGYNYVCIWECEWNLLQMELK